MKAKRSTKAAFFERLETRTLMSVTVPAAGQLEITGPIVLSSAADQVGSLDRKMTVDIVDSSGNIETGYNGQMALF